MDANGASVAYTARASTSAQGGGTDEQLRRWMPRVPRTLKREVPWDCCAPARGRGLRRPDILTSEAALSTPSLCVRQPVSTRSSAPRSTCGDRGEGSWRLRLDDERARKGSMPWMPGNQDQYRAGFLDPSQPRGGRLRALRDLPIPQVRAGRRLVRVAAAARLAGGEFPRTPTHRSPGVAIDWKYLCRGEALAR